MKNLICVLLILALVCFLAVSNPTTEEFSQWYAQQCYPETENVVDQMMENFTQYLAQTATRDDYLVCSIYKHEDHTILGIALRFYPIDELSVQVADLRSDYASWLEENTDVLERSN